ncbi:hypothetical protein D3C86_1946390 [compost metagenome]
MLDASRIIEGEIRGPVAVGTAHLWNEEFLEPSAVVRLDVAHLVQIAPARATTVRRRASLEKVSELAGTRARPALEDLRIWREANFARRTHSIN